MKIIFLFACILFGGSCYSQQNDLLDQRQKINHHIQKKKKEQIIKTAAKLSDQPVRDNVIICYPQVTLLEKMSAQIDNEKKLYIFPSGEEINTPLFRRELCEKPESCIKAPDYSTNQWTIKPLTQVRLKNLQDFLKGSEADSSTYFN